MNKHILKILVWLLAINFVSLLMLFDLERFPRIENQKLDILRRIRDDSSESLSEIISELDSLLGIELREKVVEIVEDFLGVAEEKGKALGLLRDFLREKQADENYPFIKFIILALIRGLFEYNYVSEDDYENLILREPVYELKLDLSQFKEKLEKTAETVIGYFSTSRHTQAFWREMVPEGFRALVEIFSEQNNLPIFLIMPRMHLRDGEVRILEKEYSLGPLFYFFKNENNKEIIKDKFSQVKESDFSRSVSYLLLKSINGLAKDNEEWLKRIAYQNKNFGSFQDGYKIVPLWARRAIILKFLTKAWGPRLANIGYEGMDYYNWENLKIIPIWRIMPRFFPEKDEFDGQEVDLTLPVELPSEEEVRLSLEGLYLYYIRKEKKFSDIRDELKLYAHDAIDYFYAWVDDIRWVYHSNWKDSFPSEENERKRILKKILLLIAQERGISFKEITSGMFRHIKFARKPKTVSKDLSRLVTSFGWDYFQSLIVELENEIPQEVEEIKEKLTQQSRRINWNKYYFESIKQVVDEKIEKNPLEVTIEDLENDQELRYIVGSFIGDTRQITLQDLAQFKGVLYIDFNLLGRIAIPFTTLDYLLRFYYFDPFSLNTRLPKAVVREIDYILKKKLDKDVLTRRDYQDTKVIDLIDYLLEENPLQLLASIDRRLFELAKNDLSQINEIRQMGLLGFYNNNLAR